MNKNKLIDPLDNMEEVGYNLSRKEQRKREALVRQKARAERGDKKQLAKLRRNGHGHCKEAARLALKLAEQKKNKKERQ